MTNKFNTKNYRPVGQKVSEKEIKLICGKLRKAYTNLPKIANVHKLIVIKVYLQYQIDNLNLQFDSTTELQVFLYKLAVEIFDEFDVRMLPTSNVISGSTAYSESLVSTAKDQQNEISGDGVDATKNLRREHKKLIQGLFEPYSDLPVSDEQFNQIKSQLVEKIVAHICRVDLAMVFAHKKTIEKILGALQPRNTQSTKKGILGKLTNLFVSDNKQYEKVFNRIKKYHHKGLLLNDCQRIYVREVLKNEM